MPLSAAPRSLATVAVVAAAVLAAGTAYLGVSYRAPPVPANEDLPATPYRVSIGVPVMDRSSFHDDFGAIAGLERWGDEVLVRQRDRPHHNPSTPPLDDAPAFLVDARSAKARAFTVGQGRRARDVCLCGETVVALPADSNAMFLVGRGQGADFTWEERPLPPELRPPPAQPRLSFWIPLRQEQRDDLRGGLRLACDERTIAFWNQREIYFLRAGMWMGGAVRGSTSGDIAYGFDAERPDEWTAFLAPGKLSTAGIRDARMFRGRLYVTLVGREGASATPQETRDAVASLALGGTSLRLELLPWSEREPVGQEIFSLAADGDARLVAVSRARSKGTRAYSFDGARWTLIAEATGKSSLPTNEPRLVATPFSGAGFDREGRVLLGGLLVGVLREAPGGYWDWLTPGWPTAQDGFEVDPTRDADGKAWSWPSDAPRFWDAAPSAVDVGDELVIAQDGSIVVFDPRTRRARPVTPP